MPIAPSAYSIEGIYHFESQEWILSLILIKMIDAHRHANHYDNRVFTTRPNGFDANDRWYSYGAGIRYSMSGRNQEFNLMAQIKNILKKIDKLRPIPSVIHQVLGFAQDPDRGISELIELVEHDPAITANLLKICNSAHMGLPVKVDSIHKAISLMGTQRVVELVLDQNLGANLQQAQNGYQLEKGELWKQSVAAAMICRTLAERRQLENLPAIYTAALLKDIGKVVLDDFVARDAARIRRMVDSKGISFIEAEKACIGMDHATLGGIIARQWKFSSHLIFMIENHHLSDLDARRDTATATIYLADMVAMLAGSCVGVDRLAYPIYENLFADNFLAKDELKALIFAYEGYLKGAERMLDL